MGRPLIAAALAFVVSLLAGTGVTVLRARAAHGGTAPVPAVDADAASRPVGEDSLLLDEGESPTEMPMPAANTAPSASAASPTAAGSATATSTAVPDASRGPTTASPARPGTPPITAIAGADSAQQEYSARVGRLAKLFVAMSPREAAKVLEQMSDHDVLAILGGLPERRAGEILAVMSPARSATIARAMLERREGVRR